MTWNQALIDGPISIEGVDGYHLNVAPEVYSEDLAAFVMTPANPRRVFAGAETVFLRFADEAEARAALPGYWTDAPE